MGGVSIELKLSIKPDAELLIVLATNSDAYIVSDEGFLVLFGATKNPPVYMPRILSIAFSLFFLCTQ